MKTQDKKQKTNEEILKEIKRKYQFAYAMRDYWLLEESKSKGKSNTIREFINEYQTRMNTLHELYMFITGLDLFTVIEELRRKDAE